MYPTGGAKMVVTKLIKHIIIDVTPSYLHWIFHGKDFYKSGLSVTFPFPDSVGNL